MNSCLPFRLACYGLIMAWFTGSLRLQDGTAMAGRSDLLSAVCLPYCTKFVTADWAQENELRQIAEETETECKVLSFEEFNRSFAPVLRP